MDCLEHNMLMAAESYSASDYEVWECAIPQAIAQEVVQLAA